MPPKKKKGKGSAAGKKEKPAEKGKVEPVSEESKEHYQLQIRDLEGRLERYQKKSDEVSAKENFFKTQFDQLSSDKKEIVSFLKRTLNQRIDEIADLNDQLSGLQQAKDAEKDAYETQLAQMRHEFQETKDRLTSENMLLAGKLASLEEFRVQKEDLMAKFAALEEKLRKQEEEHKDMMYTLEKKAVLDKDRLKKEMVQRVNTVAAEFRRVSNDQMAETTKRAIRENVAISTQLAKMSEKSLDLIQENDELKEQESELRKKLEMLEENEKEFVKNNLSSQKVIRMLTERCQQQQKMLDVAIEKEHDLNHLHMEHQALQEEAQALRQRLMNLEDEVQRLMDEMNKANQQLEDEVKKKQSVEKVLSQAASSLKDMLMEKSSDEDDDKLVDSLARRNQMLHSLLVLLNSAAILGLGPALNEFQSRDPHYMEQYMPAKGSRQTVPPTFKGPGVIPHYQIGDLGLVPRPDVSNAILSKIGMLSRTTKLGPIQAHPALAKDLLTLSQDGNLPKQKALPGISSSSPSNGLLMAK
ncbi:cilia- and flagella-associated protein 157 [Dendropsophus ebraccatus]|uniref:cilia- and flagella-associated protein 157 n=1 Tax=Dendropsophus ebraccatus TaxID=150705 RepID=UPI003831A30C